MVGEDLLCVIRDDWMSERVAPLLQQHPAD